MCGDALDAVSGHGVANRLARGLGAAPAPTLPPSSEDAFGSTGRLRCAHLPPRYCHSFDAWRCLRRGQRPLCCQPPCPRARRRPSSDAATFYRGCFRICRSGALRALATAFLSLCRCVSMLEARSAAPGLQSILVEDSAPPPLRRCYLLPRMLSDLQVGCAARTCHRVSLTV